MHAHLRIGLGAASRMVGHKSPIAWFELRQWPFSCQIKSRRRPSHRPWPLASFPTGSGKPMERVWILAHRILEQKLIENTPSSTAFMRRPGQPRHNISPLLHREAVCNGFVWAVVTGAYVIARPDQLLYGAPNYNVQD